MILTTQGVAARMTEAPQGGFSGIHLVTVPGAVNGWWKMHQRFGRLPWAELFAPAIHYARNGFPVTEIIHEEWARSGAKWPGRVPAVDILQTSSRLGGLLASNDFTEYESELVEPVSTTYRGARVFVLPPNGQGG
jgi:gamma-glutamyltranspeptidase/glutathione hydrolase